MTAEIQELSDALKTARLKSYARLRGGYSVPLAGLVYWAVLGALGYVLPFETWILAAFFGSGAIFPLALLFSKILRNPFMKEKSAVGSVLPPAFIGMLLFWPMIVGAAQEAPALITLILAIGMSIHWPVIGWSYGRTTIYSLHAIVRAVLVTYIWLSFPEHRLTWLPLSVAAVYAVTVIVLLIDSARFRTSANIGAAA